ncbi:hypothetical protein BDP81DRAFT_464797 [Colletotrichum phormii]|uniref:Fatty acid desaturase domain-containing protein n=1 Tax=Colletotrichum phormii TaxID=359342 RepID=A0AAJ0E9Q8_9PEZI|nr:uncharacterized protein BDP81DRAFT_464797 [Colletotrichum phormii]KAK1624254.1 hypothetical protein BDP81DRAFT_464797 [Colletotrichum phormii]
MEMTSLGDLRKVIPQDCFRPCTQTSLYYIARDVVALAVLASTWTHTILLAWTAYSFLQGLVCTGIWVLAHECGHGSLFSSARMNETFGFILHSFLMVPYFSWKYTHRRHHRFTGHATRDVAFVPAMKPADSDRDMFPPSAPMEESDVPIVQVVSLMGQQLLGWPLHVLFNVSAGKDSLLREVSGPSHWLRCSKELGATSIILLYLLPYLWVNNWLVAITYLQHNHPSVPHYTDDGWNFIKGALSTIDRDFGFIGRHFFHLIIDRHVVHHLFPRIPFYKTDTATAAIKSVLGELYHSEDSSFLGELWYQFRTLKYVENDPHRPGCTRWTL